MIKCAFCEYQARSQSGMAQHVRSGHPLQWRGSVKESFPPGFEMGTPEPGIYIGLPGKRKKGTRKPIGSAFAKKGEKKIPIKQDCLWCSYTSKHPPGLAHHIKAVHPEHWKGSLSVTLGKTPPVKIGRLSKDKLRRREYAKRLRERYALEGRNSRGELMPPGWMPRKSPRKYTRRKSVEIPVEERPSERVGPMRGHIDFCPRCGGHIEPFELTDGLIRRTEVRTDAEGK